MSEKKLHEHILQTIHERHITVRPRLYFTLKALALACMAIGIFVLSIFVCMFIFFSIRINHHDALLGFGPRGLWFFVTIFPWPLLIADLALMALLSRLLREFQIGYRSPQLLGVLVVCAVIVAGGISLDEGAGLSDQMLRVDRQQALPKPLSGVFTGARMHPGRADGMCRCVVTEIGTSTITAYREDDSTTTTFTILIPRNTDHATTSGIQVGDTILVVGDRDQNSIRAFGIRVIEKETTEPE